MTLRKRPMWRKRQRNYVHTPDRAEDRRRLLNSLDRHALALELLHNGRHGEAEALFDLDEGAGPYDGLRAENERLRQALRKHWTWGQYQRSLEGETDGT